MELIKDVRDDNGTVFHNWSNNDIPKLVPQKESPGRHAHREIGIMFPVQMHKILYY